MFPLALWTIRCVPNVAFGVGQNVASLDPFEWGAAATAVVLDSHQLLAEQ